MTKLISFLMMVMIGQQGFAQGNYTTRPVRQKKNQQNLISLPSIDLGGNINVTNEAGAQSETSIAVNPTNPQNILMGVNDLTSSATVYESVDGGKTFVKSNFAANPGDFCYDTWLSFNEKGDAFLSYECSDQRVAYRLAGQTEWTSIKLTMAGTGPDRDMITIDNSSKSSLHGSVYIGYDDYDKSNAPFLLYSRDGQNNWTQSGAIADTNTIGVNAATGPQGQVYATWESFKKNQINFAFSKDGAATFADPVNVTTYRMNTTGFFIMLPAQQSRGIVPFPMMAVDTAGSFSGRIYVTYPDQNKNATTIGVFVRYSDDDGKTWSDEIQVNDGPTTSYAFSQAIAVANNGVVAVSFYDTRNDSSSIKVDRYVSFSKDGGQTWSANQKISTDSSDETAPSADGNQYGDYQGLACDSLGQFHASWTDARPGTQAEEMFYSSVPAP